MSKGTREFRRQKLTQFCVSKNSIISPAAEKKIPKCASKSVLLRVKLEKEEEKSGEGGGGGKF